MTITVIEDGTSPQKVGKRSRENRSRLVSPSLLFLALVFLLSFCLSNIRTSILSHAQKTDVMHYLTSSTTELRRGISDQAAHASPQPVNNNLQRHILFALSGNHSGFFGEFEVALKSVLLHLPPHNTTIHIMTDGPAHLTVQTILTETLQLSNWTTPHPLHVVAYNLQDRQDQWTAQIEERMAMVRNMTSYSFFRHTVGAYYRLLSGEVLPSDVDTVLYLDTDTVVMANLENLWQHHVTDDSNDKSGQSSLTENVSYYFQWGSSQCSAFMILRPHKMPDVWKLFAQVPPQILRQLLRPRPVADDQFILQAVEKTFPHVVGPTLPDVYDISAQDGPWKYGKPHLLLEHRPHGAGMLHFNGGGESKEAYYNQHRYVQQPVWDLAKFYVSLPWKWAQFMVQSQISKGQGYPVSVRYL